MIRCADGSVRGDLGISDDGIGRTNAFWEKIWISKDSKARRDIFKSGDSGGHQYSLGGILGFAIGSRRVR